MKKIALLLSFLAISSIGFAQGVTATATWTMQEAPTLAQSYVYTLKLDTAQPLTLTTTCVAVNNVTQCSAPVANYVVGNHTAVLTASNNGSSASTTFQTGAVPSTPGGAKIIVIIVGNND
jgi:hypothetical protein